MALIDIDCIFPALGDNKVEVSKTKVDDFYDQFEAKITMIQPDTRIAFVNGVLSEISARGEHFCKMKDYLEGKPVSIFTKREIEGRKFESNEQIKEFADEVLALCDILGSRAEMICKKYKIKHKPYERVFPIDKDIRTQIKKHTQQVQPATKRMPAELNKPEIIQDLQKLISKGYLTKDYQLGEGKSYRDLSILFSSISKKYHLSHRDEAVSWKPFKQLMGIKNNTLANGYKDYFNLKSSSKIAKTRAELSTNVLGY